MAISRRYFLFGTMLAGVIPRAGFGSVPSLKFLGYQSPNEKMNIAGIGAGGRAMQVLGALESENIVALADVDWARGADGFKRWEKAAKYRDFRQMLDKELKNIDAVTVVTPDHGHAVQALAAMQRGMHVYVEKPLTRTPWEARLLADAAARYKVATQMGNQGYSHEATRVAAEIIWSGEIGDVTEVHSFRGRASWPEGMPTLPVTERVPDTLDWDLWLGPAAFRPYTSGDEAYRKEYPNQFGFYLPFNWRGFYDFGSTLIGDWGIHQLGPANLALRLGSPTSVECVTRGDGSSPYTFPRGGIVIKWEFAARENMPPVTVYWSHTGDVYTPQGMTVEEMRAIPGTGPTIDTGPAEGRGRGLGGGREGRAGQAAPGAPGQPGAQPTGAAGRGRGRGGQPGSGYNTVYVGTKGHLGTGGRGESVGLIPGSRWAEYKLPPRMLTRSPGHQRDWVRACKGGEPACSNFSVAGPYTEWMVLGAVAARVNGKLLWDPKKMEFTNSKEANRYVKPMFRKGWEVKSIT
jgi:hypothetical protein